MIMSSLKQFHDRVDNFPDLIQLLSQECPNQEAYCYASSGTSLTYGRLHQQACALASVLNEICHKGDRVLLLYPDARGFVAAFFGCLYAGVIAVPVAPPRKAQGNACDRMLSLIKHASIKVIVTTLKTRELLSSVPLGKDVLYLTFDNVINNENTGKTQQRPFRHIPSSAADQWQPKTINGNDLAFLQYTSGSTGHPKGVMVSHQNLWVNSHNIYNSFGHTPHSKGVIWLPHFHDMGLIGGLLQPLYGAFPCMLMTPLEFMKNPLNWLKNISDYSATSSGGPNFAYELCVKKASDEKLKGLDLSRWNLAFCGAEPIRPDTLKKFAEKFSTVGFDEKAFYPCYGMAETTLIISGGKKGSGLQFETVCQKELHRGKVKVDQLNGSDQTTEIVSCGNCIPEHRIKIVDSTGSLCPEGTVGEVWISGPSVAQGYWNDPEETHDSFQARVENSRKNYFRSGDMGFIKDENLYITGRKKEMIIVNGQNHYPQDLEKTLFDEVSIHSDALGVVFSVENDGKEVVVGVFEPSRREKIADYEAFYTDLRQKLSKEHSLPLYDLAILNRRQIPKTSSGKVQRTLCKTHYLNGELEIVWQKQAIHSKKQKSQAIQSTHSQNETAIAPEVKQQADTIAQIITETLNQTLKNVSLSESDWDSEFDSFGIESLELVGLIGELESKLQLKLSPSLVFNYPTINKLSRKLRERFDIEPDRVSSITNAKGLKEIPNPIEASVKKQIRRISENHHHPEDIAIIGIGCHLPQVDNVEQFWLMLAEGKNLSAITPSQRWYSFSIENYIDKGSFFEQVSNFDPEFFSISPKEATYIDPQQRMLMKTVQQALDDAGISATELKGSNTGVYMGISTSDYALVTGNNISLYSGLGNAHSIAANRISYFYDLRGPSLSVDTACSSSLVALDQAINSLSNKQSDLAIVGGVNLILTPHLQKIFTDAEMLSRDGRCKTFDSDANGYARGEGSGAIILKPLSQARADGDRIYAAIMGCAVNQDGRSNGITAPNGNSQVAVIQQALEKSGLNVEDIGYIEAHGTGTSLGDLIEFEALENVYAQRRSGPLYVGSVKTNLGHTEAAAGMMSVIKAALMQYHNQLVPHINFRHLNPQIESIQKNILINTERRQWPQNLPNVVGVSSFGFGGTNCHVIVRKVNVDNRPAISPTPPVTGLAVSAHHPVALRIQLRELEKHLHRIPKSELSEFCRIYNTRRRQEKFRCFLSGTDADQLIASAMRSNQAVKAIKPEKKVVFMFPGQGTQQLEMGKLFYEHMDSFKHHFELCNQLCQKFSGIDLTATLFGKQHSDWTLNPVISLLAIFSVSYSLAMSVKAAGVEPDVAVGHGLGEHVASCIAGCWSLEDALKAVHERARLTEEGKMAVVLTTPEAVEEAVSQFEQAIDKLAQDGFEFYLDFSADSSLEKFVKPQLQGRHRTFALTNRFNELSAFYNSLGKLWQLGFDIDWQSIYQGTHRGQLNLPPTSFNERNFWIHQSQPFTSLNNQTKDKPVAISIEHDIKQMVAELLNVEVMDIDVETPFLEMGADSLVLLSAVQKIKDKYGVSLSTKELFGELSTLLAVIEYVNENTTTIEQTATSELSDKIIRSNSVQETSEDTPLKLISNNDLEFSELNQIIHRQLDVMAQQIEMLKGQPPVNLHTSPSLPVTTRAPETKRLEKKTGGTHSSNVHQANVHQAWFKRDLSKKKTTADKENHIRHLEDKFNRKFKLSKNITQQFRPVLADNRASAGFRRSTKELLFPIIGERSSGSRIWDKDGNEFIDFTMGFGCNLLGHNPKLVTEAVSEQLSQGMQIGPQTELAGQVASLVTKLTGLERVAFCNSGSESIMTAIRLARAVTGRDKVVIFEGSYHGIFDGILGRSSTQSETHETLPIASGTPSSLLKDVWVLEYGSEDSLRFIEQEADYLAAVLVEPIQSRHPELQPREFLHKLRAITESHQAALIFDEVITGFRLGSAGAQHYFEVQADIATYGKIVGGGLPIGLVAGKSRFMDPIDGGNWQYGDDSYPQVNPIFFAGTFSKHPLTMAASKAVLGYIDKHQGKLYRTLAEKTQYVVEELNQFFQANAVDIKVVNAGSLFRFKYSGNYDLLFYLLLYRGIFIWEGRNCFISEAHSYEDLDAFIKAVKQSVCELKCSGYFGPAGLPVTQPYQPNDAQQRFLSLLAQGKYGSICGNIGCIINFSQPLDLQLLNKAWKLTLGRHDVFFFGLTPGRNWSANDFTFDDIVNLPGGRESQAQTTALFEFTNREFALDGKALIRAGYCPDSQGCKLIIVSHHSITDGYSYAVLIEELLSFYSSISGSEGLKPHYASSYRSYIDYVKTLDPALSVEYWHNKLANFPSCKKLPIVSKTQPLYAGDRIRCNLVSINQRLGEHATKLKVSKFIFLYTLFDSWLRCHWNTDELIIGISLADRDFDNSDYLVGQCVRLLPMIMGISRHQKLEDLMNYAKQQLGQAIAHKDIPTAVLCSEQCVCPIEVTFNLEPKLPLQSLGKWGASIESLPIAASEFPLMVNILETQNGLQMELDYQYRYFTAGQAQNILNGYRQLIDKLLSTPSIPENLSGLLDNIDKHCDVEPTIPENEQKTGLTEVIGE